MKGSRVSNLNTISENVLTAKLLLVIFLLPKIHLDPFLKEAMDIKGFKKEVWVDITNLISRVSKIQMFIDPAEHDSVSLQVNPEARKGKWEGNTATALLTVWNVRTPWRRTRRLTYWAMLRCWKHKWHFFMHINKFAYTNVHDFLIIQSFFI